MTKYISNLTKNLSRVLALVLALPLLCAWVSPVDLTADINGTGSVSISGTDIVSCTLNTDPAPATCHRWDLIWESVNDGSALTQQSDWVSNVPNDAGGNEWRLPTIKELTRLIAFGEEAHATLIESATIKNWFTGDTFWATNSVGLEAYTKTVWLISSTYRDIDENVGDDAGDAKGQAQVFAINIINGEIKTFEPGYKEDADGAPDGNELRLCDALNSTGGCTTYGDTTVNTVFALKVRTQSVTDLL